MLAVDLGVHLAASGLSVLAEPVFTLELDRSGEDFEIVPLIVGVEAAEDEELVQKELFEV